MSGMTGSEVVIDCPMIIGMAFGAPTNTPRDIARRAFRSDMFNNLYELLRVFPGLSAFLQNIIRIHVVIDANVVLGEIRFRLKRQKPEARSDLGEAIDSGIVVAIAPRFLLSEIDDEHLSRILPGTGKTITDARREWASLCPKIRLYEPSSNGDPGLQAIDPDDVAYAVTCEEVGAEGLISRDRHLRKMGAPVVKGIPDRALRDCARSGAVVMGITATSGFAITVTYGSIRGVWLLLEKAFEGFRALPGWAKALLVGGAVALIAHPKSRARISEKWTGFRESAAATLPDLLDILDVIGQIAAEYDDAQREAGRSKEMLKALLPEPPSKTLIQHARTVCLRQDIPLSLDELLRLMQQDGYQAPTRSARAGLREALLASRQFFETTGGEWSMSRPKPEPAVPTERRYTAVRRRSVTNHRRLKRPSATKVAPSDLQSV